MIDPADDKQQSCEQHARKNLVLNTVRVIGAAFMLAGTACVFNLGGLASALGIADGQTEKILGGILFIIGILDYLVIPPLLERKIL